jgi:hypothetical protein
VLVAPHAITEVSCVPAEYDRGAHVTVVTEVQAVLKQLSEVVSEDVGVKFEAPNPSPLIVNVEPALFDRFELSRPLTLTSGAAPRDKTTTSTSPKKSCLYPYCRS